MTRRHRFGRFALGLAAGGVIGVVLLYLLWAEIQGSYEGPLDNVIEVLLVCLFAIIPVAFISGLVALRRWGILAAGVGLLFLILWLPNVFVRHHGGGSNESAGVANLRTINTAQVTYLSSSGGTYGRIADLIAVGLLDEGFKATRSGYRYQVAITPDGKEYTATAEPDSTKTGRFGYYSTPDGVVRYAERSTSRCQPCFPNGQSGQPVQ